MVGSQLDHIPHQKLEGDLSVHQSLQHCYAHAAWGHVSFAPKEISCAGMRHAHSAGSALPWPHLRMSETLLLR